MVRGGARKGGGGGGGGTSGTSGTSGASGASESWRSRGAGSNCATQAGWDAAGACTAVLPAWRTYLLMEAAPARPQEVWPELRRLCLGEDDGPTSNFDDGASRAAVLYWAATRPPPVCAGGGGSGSDECPLAPLPGVAGEWAAHAVEWVQARCANYSSSDADDSGGDGGGGGGGSHSGGGDGDSEAEDEAPFALTPGSGSASPTCSAACSAHLACVAFGLQDGACCPQPGGWFLGCCPVLHWV